MTTTSTPPLFSAEWFRGENRNATIVLLISPFVLTAWKYYGTKPFYLANLTWVLQLSSNPDQSAEWYTFLCSFLLLGLFPLLIISKIFHRSLSSFGLQFGDWRFGLKAVAILAPIFILSTYPSSKMPQFLAEYPLFKDAGLTPTAFLTHAFAYLLFYIGWEVFFRGFMQFGLRDRLGDWNAILVQTLASCLLHIGKPDGEIFSSILGGIIWGLLVMRTQSILWPLLLHWLLGVSLDFFICYVH